MKEELFKLTVAIIASVVVCAVLSFPTMWLWNWLIPEIFGLIKIDFWQALGLNLLASILFQKGSSSK